MSQNIVDTFTTHLKNVLTRALCLAVEEHEENVRPEHLLWALSTEKGSIAGEVLHKHGVNTAAVRQLTSATVSPYASDESATTPLLSDASKRMIERAVYIAHMYRHRFVGTEHLLAGLLHVSDPKLQRFFETERIVMRAIQEQLSVVFKGTAHFPQMEPPRPALPAVLDEEEPEEEEGGEEKSETPALDFFTRDLTAVDIAKELDPVIGREAEIERVMEILCRRTKNNPILTGEPGVGKTAIVEGLAKRIAEGSVPPALMDKHILALDLASVVAGTIYRGEFESRMKHLIEEVQEHPDVILFIDELHTIMGAGSASGSLDAANMLKPALARGEIHCIGATTPAEFKKYIEPDAALERRFQHVRVEEPSVEASLEILRGLAPAYSIFHHVTIEDAALSAAVRLSARYLPDRFLPDKAIDLLDEAAAGLRVRSTTDAPVLRHLRALENELWEVEEKKRQAIVEERFDEAMQLKERAARIKAELERHVPAKETEPIGTIRVEDIANILSRSTGIPVETLVEEERRRLKNLGETLARRVVGQKQVTDAVAAAILRSKTGVTAQNRPQASFLFVGPSGVGKTELARTLAAELFQNKNALIHLDMSEYGEGYTVSKLIGSPAGYVGYREGAKLTDQVRQKPYAVVLFDEIEKAHRDVQALLLQILETGTLADATGRAVSFRQTVIVLTSNIGSERFFGEALGFGSGTGHQGTSEAIRKDLEEQFRPELLNRLDQVLVFRPLDHAAMTEVARLELEALSKRLQEQNLSLMIEDAVAETIAGSLLEEKVGARAIRRHIQDHIETRIAEKLLSSRRKKTTLRLKAKNGSVVLY